MSISTIQKLQRTQTALRGILRAAGCLVDSMSDSEILTTAEQWITDNADIRLTYRGRRATPETVSSPTSDERVRTLLSRVIALDGLSKAELRVETRLEIEVKFFGEDGNQVGRLEIGEDILTIDRLTPSSPAPSSDGICAIYNDLLTIIDRRGQSFESSVHEFVQIPGLDINL